MDLLKIYIAAVDAPQIYQQLGWRGSCGDVVATCPRLAPCGAFFVAAPAGSSLRALRAFLWRAFAAFGFVGLLLLLLLGGLALVVLLGIATCRLLLLRLSSF